MHSLYTIFSRNYWNYMSVSFWSCAKCQKHFGEYNQRDPDTHLPTEHRSLALTPLQYFLEVDSAAFWGSLCKHVTAMVSAIYTSDDQTATFFPPYSRYLCLQRVNLM